MIKSCANCKKNFKNSDEVVITDAMGGKDLVHIDCLYDYVLNASMQEYFDTYEDYQIENE